jgi:hypothetical protein
MYTYPVVDRIYPFYAGSFRIPCFTAESAENAERIEENLCAFCALSALRSEPTQNRETAS